MLAYGVNYLMANSDPGPVITTHGDFYEANILMDSENNSVSALIDVDSLGPGYRVDDLGCLLGHISVLPYLAPQAYPHVPAELERWRRSARSRLIHGPHRTCARRNPFSDCRSPPRRRP